MYLNKDPLIATLVAELLKGHTALPYDEPVSSPYLHQEKGRLFLKSIYLMQKKLENIPLSSSPCDEPPLNKGLLEGQRKAILFALCSSFTLLTGGPGTGKSFTIAELIKSYRALFGPDKLIALAAPTGKATQHLQPLLEGLPIKLATLHRLLDVYKQPLLEPEDKVPLIYDLIVIDEASMIDLPLMARLLTHLKKGAKLVLVGDPEQLPPVGFGQPFIDLLALYPDHVKRLTECLRSDRKEILELAAAIRAGQEPVLPLLAWPPLLEPVHYGSTIEEALSRQGESRILTPLVEGPFGSRQLSAKLFRQNPGIAPIIVTENDFKQGLYNGQLGVRDATKAYFKTSTGIQSFMLADLPAFELAYAISVHKAQGSEFDDVFLILPPGSEAFGKELLYTAVTRAKKRLRLAAPPGQIALCLAHSSLRNT